jgi:hypothetical protein
MALYSVCDQLVSLLLFNYPRILSNSSGSLAIASLSLETPHLPASLSRSSSLYSLSRNRIGMFTSLNAVRYQIESPT